MSGHPLPLIKNYLKEASFWHVANIGWGCKLDPKLINAFIERWRLETHTFHLLYGERTIILEDVQLQLGLSVYGSVFTRSAQSADWGVICYDLLGAILDNIYGGRIEIGWLRNTFSEPTDDLIEVERIRYARAYILEIIGGYLMPNLSQNLVHLRWLLKYIDFRVASELSWGLPCWQHCTGRCAGRLNQIKPKSEVAYHYYNHGWNHSVSYVGIPTTFEDIRLLLNQRLEVHTPYEDPTIQAVIPDEFFQNLNIWHVKVPLVNYATIGMHQTDRVLWKEQSLRGLGSFSLFFVPRPVSSSMSRHYMTELWGPSTDLTNRVFVGISKCLMGTSMNGLTILPMRVTKGLIDSLILSTRVDTRAWGSVMDPDRTMADDVESDAPTPTEGAVPSDNRPPTVS
ncbi:hypothetical protein CXB51_019501 [Gossypium anomalum]|uniref:Aminotransferase-like plant mobile domain-containing protein n=1 Tax=Gossypium anomalum TaxID=47600 RepID=A0A8J6CXT9_9ROSI|nr:hypothetical protein CXB51_019501 [Gossypium anomalum]